MPPAITAPELADLIEALASLAWPAVVGFFLYLFRSDIAALMKRIRRGRAAGVELELDRELDLVQESTRAAAEAVPPGAGQTAEADEAAEAAEVTAADDRLVRDVLDEAARSPKVALMALSAEIERRSREVLASTGHGRDWRAGLGHQLDRLELSPRVREAAKEFRDVRNRIVHGHAATDNDALRAIDIGIELLRAIERIPHEVHYVEEPRVECFADPEGRQPHDFHAILLRSIHTISGKVTERAYPYTQPDPPKGQPVSWEWRSGREFPESWYRHPDGSIKYGWTGSLEFAGRPIHV